MMSRPEREAGVRFSLRWKIILPFVLLVLFLGLSAVFLVSRLLTGTESERFVRLLADSGQQALDAVVRQEVQLLEVQRLVANTEGVLEAVQRIDAEDLRTRVLPLVINAGADVVAVLDQQGTSLLAIRRLPEGGPGEYETLRGETYYADWGFVQAALAGRVEEGVGSKQVGLEAIRLGDQETHVFFIAGPLRNRSGNVIGVVLTGEYLQDFADRLSEEAGANVTVYDVPSGQPLATTLEPQTLTDLALPAEQAGAALAPGEAGSPIRRFEVAGAPYGEVLLPFVARQGTVQLGVLGVSLLDVPGIRAGGMPLEGILWPVAISLGLALLLVVVVGLLVSNLVTEPLAELMQAMRRAEEGDLEVRVEPHSADELGVLAAGFNHLLERLSAGRTALAPVTPAGESSRREGAPQALEAGQSVRATVLVARVYGIVDAEGQSDSDPAETLQALNEAFAGMVPILEAHGGVVDRLAASEVMAFFGVLPRPVPPQVSALQATHAGLALLEFVQQLNERRRERVLEDLRIAVGVATGPVVAGAIGSKGRLRYSVFGLTVDVACGIQQLIRREGGVLISEETFRRLAATRGQFHMGRQGVARIPVQRKGLIVHEVIGRSTVLVDG